LAEEKKFKKTKMKYTAGKKGFKMKQQSTNSFFLNSFQKTFSMDTGGVSLNHP